MISAIFQHRCPGQIAVPLNHGVCASEIVRLLRIKSCVNSTEHHKCALLSSQPANLIATQRISGMDSNSNNVAGRNAFGIEGFQSFVNDHRIAKAGGSSSGEYIEPARRDHPNTEGLVTRINEIRFQENFSDAGIFTACSRIISHTGAADCTWLGLRRTPLPTISAFMKLHRAIMRQHEPDWRKGDFA